MKRTTVLWVALAAILITVPHFSFADPTLSDKENFAEGLKIHQQGNYKDAYEFYFKDMSPTPKTQAWLKDYREKYLGPQADPTPPPDSGTGMIQPTISPKPITKKDNYFFFNLGPGMPSNPTAFTSYWGTGFSFGGGFGFGISKFAVFVLDVSYSRFPFKSTAFLLDSGYYGYGLTLSGGSTSSFLGTANIKIKFSPRDPPVLAYCISGVGIGSWSLQALTISDGFTAETLTGSSETKPSFRLGLGLDFKIAPSTKLFIESNGIVVGTSGSTTSYGIFKLGLLFRLP